MLLALADKQAVAQKNARALERLALAERVLFGDEHLVHQRGIAEQKEPFIEELEPRGVAEIAFQFVEKIQARRFILLDRQVRGNALNLE